MSAGEAPVDAGTGTSAPADTGAPSPSADTGGNGAADTAAGGEPGEDSLDYWKERARKAEIARDQATADRAKERKARQQLTEEQRKAQEEQRKRAEEQGDYQALLEQEKAWRAEAELRLARLEELEEAQAKRDAAAKNRADTLRKKLPAELRDVVPDGIAPEEQLDRLERLVQHTNNQTPSEKPPPGLPPVNQARGSTPTREGLRSISDPQARKEAIRKIPWKDRFRRK